MKEVLEKLNQGIKLFALKSPSIEREFILAELWKYAQSRTLSVYFWNPGFLQVQKVHLVLERIELIQATEINLEETEFQLETFPEKILLSCLSQRKEGIFILEGLGSRFRENVLNYQLHNIYFQLQSHPVEQYFLLMDECLEIPLNLCPILPLVEPEIPNAIEVANLLQMFVESPSPELVRACIGLPKGEIALLMQSLSSQGKQDSYHEAILIYKQRKLQSRGLTILPSPDVPDVGGLDLLEKDLDKIKRLFDPEALKRGLRPPKGALLWGLPGTGKSLVAKMAAKKIGAILVSCDWNQLLDTTVAGSLSNLKYVLDLVDNMGACILFFDEFEKAFAGWNSQEGGGVLAKMAARLLTWLQDHETPVVMLATINHLDMLPVELTRRFEYIWFFNSSLHNGAMWEVFQLHIEKHFPGVHQQFTDEQWRKLFIEYRGCSPAEIGQAVKRTHSTLYYQGLPRNIAHSILWEALLEERSKFKPALANLSTSNQLAKILLEADFARKVCSSDRSRFAIAGRKLFEPPRELDGCFVPPLPLNF